MLLLWVFYSSLFPSTEIQIFQYFKEMCQIARNVYVKTGWFFSLLQSLFPFILNITWGEENPAVIIPQLAAPGFSEDAGMLLALSCEECDKLQAGVWAWLQDAAVDSRDMKALQSEQGSKPILQALESNWEGKRHPHPLTRTVSDINKSQCLDLQWLSSLNNQIILVFPFSHFHNYSKISLLKKACLVTGYKEDFKTVLWFLSKILVLLYNENLIQKR